jgi:RNA polymerase sigma factor (sigma-70 family)
MIAHAKRIHPESCDVQQEFLSMLPTICSVAQHAFRGLRPDAREDAVQEVIAHAFVAFTRLVQQGRQHLAFGSVLGRYAVAQYLVGRRIGSRLNSHDVMAPGQRRCRVQSLDDFDAQDGQWREALVEDTQTPVPDQASFRIDFPAWLSRLGSRDRAVAQSLAANYTTGEVAVQHGISPGRVSQLRRELHDGWEQFHDPTAGCCQVGGSHSQAATRD